MQQAVSDATMSPLSPNETCDQIMKSIKNSNLHFILQETPHSVYITIRKKFVRESEAHAKKEVQDDNSQELLILQKAYDNLKLDFEEEIKHHEESKNLAKTLEDKLDRVEANKKKQEKEKSSKLKLAKKNQDANNKDLNQNNFKVNVSVSNKFEVLEKISLAETPDEPLQTNEKLRTNCKVSSEDYLLKDSCSLPFPNPARSCSYPTSSSPSPSYTPPRTSPKTVPTTGTTQLSTAIWELSQKAEGISDRLSKRFK